MGFCGVCCKIRSASRGCKFIFKLVVVDIRTIGFHDIYTIVFGVVFKTNEQYFPVFIFIAITLWDFFSRCMTTSVDLIRGNQHIISKVYMPKYILLIQRMLVLAFKMLINLGLVAIMMIIYNVPVGINILFVVPTLFVFFVFCFACGTILLHI